MQESFNITFSHLQIVSMIELIFFQFQIVSTIELDGSMLFSIFKMSFYYWINFFLLIYVVFTYSRSFS